MSIESIEIDHLRSWIGREEEVAEDEASVDRHLPERVMRTFESWSNSTSTRKGAGRMSGSLGCRH
jgi:hypothetical protein